MRFRTNVVGPLALGLFGACFVTVGAVLVRYGAAAERDLAEHPPRVLTIAELAEAPVGSEVMVEANVSRSNPRGFGDFVAYDQREFQGYEPQTPGAREGSIYGPRARSSHEREKWRDIEHRRPALELVDRTGSTRVLRGEYAIEAEPDRFPRLDQVGMIQTNGVRIDEVVVVTGTVVAEGDELSSERSLRARSIFAGDRRAWAANAEEAAWVPRLLGIIFGSVGVLVAAAGVAWFVLARRPTR